MLYIPHPDKRCSKCGSYKSHEDFSPRPLSKARDGLNHQCKDCSAAGAKRWRTDNAQALSKHRARQREYRARCAEKVRESKHTYYITHREQILERGRRFRLEHKEEINKRARIRRQHSIEKRRAGNRRWRENNPEKKRTARKRRQMQKKNLLATLTAREWIGALEFWRGVCAYCGNGPSLFDQYQTLQQEHHAPVSRGGNYTSDNILPACQSCNYSKKDRDPDEWVFWKFGPRKGKEILKRIQDYFEWVKSR